MRTFAVSFGFFLRTSVLSLREDAKAAAAATDARFPLLPFTTAFTTVDTLLLESFFPLSVDFLSELTSDAASKAFPLL